MSDDDEILRQAKAAKKSAKAKKAKAKPKPDAPAADDLPEWMRIERANAARDRAIAKAQRDRLGTDRSRRDAEQAREAGGVQSFGGGFFFIHASSRRSL